MAEPNTPNHFYNLPIELQTRILELKQSKETEDHDEWMYHIVKNMDTAMMLYDDSLADILDDYLEEYGFRVFFDRDENRELCGWSWLTAEGQCAGAGYGSQPFVGADAIASFYIITAWMEMNAYSGDDDYPF